MGKRKGKWGNPDAELGHLVAEAVDEAFEGVLGDAVAGAARQPAPPHARRYRHYAPLNLSMEVLVWFLIVRPTLGFPNEGKEGLGDSDGTDGVDLEGLAIVRQQHPLRLPAQAQARIVVQAPEPCQTEASIDCDLGR